MYTICAVMIKLRKKYKSGSAIEIMRDAILFGDISGEISQTEFAESLEVSRIPVREALIALEYHGLIEKLTNQHVRIINLDDEAVRNVFADMSLLEMEAVNSLPYETLGELALTESAIDYHRRVYADTSPLRKIFLRTCTEIYIAFIVSNSDVSKINHAFEGLKKSLRNPEALRAAYDVYREALADELIRIRHERPALNEEE